MYSNDCRLDNYRSIVRVRVGEAKGWRPTVPAGQGRARLNTFPIGRNSFHSISCHVIFALSHPLYTPPFRRPRLWYITKVIIDGMTYSLVSQPLESNAMSSDSPISSDIRTVKSKDNSFLKPRPERLAGHHGRTRQPRLGDGVLLEKSRRGKRQSFFAFSPSLYFLKAAPFT